ncbi:MAG: pectate lyase [Planctomycetaceae bacterium]|nr:pectate lyase [Planctomycetaceae bacterium]
MKTFPFSHTVSLSCRVVLILTAAIHLTAAAIAQPDAPPTTAQVRQALDRAITFYTKSVAVNGGYVYYYSPDLQQRLGEGTASPTQIWVQPPGTPTVGMALLDAWHATQEPRFLASARDAATALIHGQLKSGAWTNSIDFDPAGQTAAYRNGKGRGRNFSTLDDDISQSALQFLMKCDQATHFNDPVISEAVRVALDALLNSQFSNGAFPQGWDGPIDQQQKSINASYPTCDWRTEGRIKEYWDMYTLNDGLAGTVVETLLVAHDIYNRPDCMAAVVRFGDFLIAAQLPEPQPAWAQQYNHNMQPIWARRFEPPAIAGRESADVLLTLMRIHEVTREPRFLKPIAPAIAWFQRSQLPDGQMARYYELQTNRPLYMQRTSGRNYQLTYDDSRLPKHYGWKNSSPVKKLQRELTRVSAGRPATTSPVSPQTVREILSSLDKQGRWLSTYHNEPLAGQPKFQPGQQYLSSAVFSQNIHLLASYLSRPGRDGRDAAAGGGVDGR